MTDGLTKNAVAVVECETLFEGIRFPSGDLLTIELTRPRKAFAIVRRMGEEIDVMSLHDDRPSAIRHADEIVALIKEGRQEEAEGRGTLQ
ncbi:hypothetical protein KCX83_04185 [Brucella oryzae]|uniref:hypothetical protein n=1 Tax=Brucella oryzae TaxID=335286 RepID=UPI001B82368F|nr:hypothetical protein [Brucella oryzae]MBR7651518.1 hypothetical protein [Brucella oryzae]